MNVALSHRVLSSHKPSLSDEFSGDPPDRPGYERTVLSVRCWRTAERFDRRNFTKGSSSASFDAPQREPRNNVRRNATLLARGTDHLQIGRFHEKVFFRLPSRSGPVLFVVCC